MRAALLAIALTATLLVPARADQTAVAANQLLGAQAIDALTTRLFLTTPIVQGERYQLYPLGFERDPLARGVSRSNLAIVTSAAVLNVAARIVFRHAPKVLRVFAFSEAAADANNLRVLSGPHSAASSLLDSRPYVRP